MSEIVNPTRPSRRRRIAAAIAAAIVGLVAGGGLLAFGIVSAIRQFPAPTAQFAAGMPASVSLDRSGEWVVYADGSDVAPSRNECRIATAEGTSVPVTTPGARVETTRGGHNWVRVATFTVESAGSYTVECTGTDGASLFAVGDPPQIGRFVAWLVGSILGMLVLTAAGIGTGIWIAVSGRRRGAAVPGPVSGYTSPVQPGR